jgi:hypothetical protein
LRRALLIGLMAACAHVQPPSPPVSELEIFERPILLASADTGTSVRDWYAAKVLRQPTDPMNPTLKSISSTAASGTNGFACLTNGCRFDIGAGANDYLTSDGTTISTGGGFNVGSTGIRLATLPVVFPGVSANATALYGNVANSAAVSATDVASITTLTAGFDRYITTFYGDNLTTPRARVFSNGALQSLYTAGTAGSGTGVTVNATSAVVPFVHKVTVTSAAMTAAATTDITIWTTPVNTRLTRIVAEVTQVFTGGALTAVTLTCGNAAGGNQYLTSNSVFTAQNTWGDAQAEIGANLLSATVADMGTSAAGVPGAITISCRFTCTTANCNAATQGSVSFEIEGVTYP